jgi:L-ornithine N5-monooxygenase
MTSQGSDDSVYDLVCIGFGTTALAFAASLVESKASVQKVLFIERRSQFEWQPQHILPENPIGSSFLKDLISTQSPRSEFTFVNFLHSTGRLVQFTNASTIRPSRLLVGTYLRWVAKCIESRGWVGYDQEGLCVCPVEGAKGKVDCWTVEVKNHQSNARSTINAKRVVLAIGAEPRIPAQLSKPELAPFVKHSSACSGLLETLAGREKYITMAIVGENQEAAELFDHLHSAPGVHSATLFIADSALRSEDDTP